MFWEGNFRLLILLDNDLIAISSWSNKASFEYDISSVKLLEISNKQSERNQSPSLSMFSESQGFLGGYKFECDHQFQTAVQWQDRMRIGIMSYH